MVLHGNFVVEPQLRGGGHDTESELLLAELALNDIATVQATRKRKAREDVPLSDEDIAFSLQADFFNDFISVVRNNQFASSIDVAIESDLYQLRRLSWREQAEHDDHLAAIALRDGHDLPRQTASQRMMEQAQPARDRETITVNPVDIESDTDSEDIESVSSDTEDMYINPETHEFTYQASRNIDRGFECVICGENVIVNHSFDAPCGHSYCRDCVINLVESSLRDERLYPLRCCQERLPLSSVFRFTSKFLRFRFLTKKCEYATPVASRVYCSNPRCSMFLGGSGDQRESITCGSCKTVSCTECKNNAHPGEECFEHQSTLQLRDTASANKWQTCPGCHTIVELSMGCYHITCRCSMQFCYLCSAPWKTCGCRRWDEELLLNDAERRARNEFGDRADDARPIAHAEWVNQTMEVLREDDGCWVHLWRYRHGPGRCEECGCFLHHYLMCCAHCQTLACRGCSANRL